MLFRVTCPYCGGPASIVDSYEIYRQNYGMVWQCKPCDAHVGALGEEHGYRPKGTLAKPELRKLRQQAHFVFDPLWRSGGMTRKQAYSWLARTLKLTEKQAHIGQFDEAKCEALIAALDRLSNLKAKRNPARYVSINRDNHPGERGLPPKADEDGEDETDLAEQMQLHTKDAWHCAVDTEEQNES